MTEMKMGNLSVEETRLRRLVFGFIHRTEEYYPSLDRVQRIHQIYILPDKNNTEIVLDYICDPKTMVITLISTQAYLDYQLKYKVLCQIIGSFIKQENLNLFDDSIDFKNLCRRKLSTVVL